MKIHVGKKPNYRPLILTNGGLEWQDAEVYDISHYVNEFYSNKPLKDEPSSNYITKEIVERLLFDNPLCHWR